MRVRVSCAAALLLLLTSASLSGATPIQTGGRLTSDSNVLAWWALSSAAKIRPNAPPPQQRTSAIEIRCARNEYESVQVVLRSELPFHNLEIQVGPFEGKKQHLSAPIETELLHALYLDVAKSTDGTSTLGLWPDPLGPLTDVIALEPGTNQAFWLRVYVPRNTESMTQFTPDGALIELRRDHVARAIEQLETHATAR